MIDITRHGKALIGKSCPIDRLDCIFTPTEAQEERCPEEFEAWLHTWEELGNTYLLTENHEKNQESSERQPQPDRQAQPQTV